MRDMLVVLLVLACIVAGLYAAHIWIPDILQKWRPKCFPRCPQKFLQHVTHNNYRCVRCGWTQRIDSTPFYYGK